MYLSLDSQALLFFVVYLIFFASIIVNKLKLYFTFL